MLATVVLDVLLGTVLIALLVVGIRNGLAMSLASILGLAAGGVAAYFLMPLIARIVPWPAWRVLLTVGAAVLLLFAGQTVGAALGRAGTRRDGGRRGPGVLSRLLGGALTVVSGSLVISLVAGGVASLGAPVVSQAARQSVVMSGIHRLTPAALDSALAQLRGAMLAQGLPVLDGPLGGISIGPGELPVLPGAPEWADGGARLAAAYASVVRISGMAYACGQSQTGSGAVIAPDRIITNAHVVAGVDRPLVEAPNGQALEGRVVYFDPEDDLAVIAVSGLEARALPVGEHLDPGDAGIVSGYPYGGPFVAAPAEVLARSVERIRDVYGRSAAERSVYTLAAEVDPGNSGGPLLAADGSVAGIVFAQAPDDEPLAYALTRDEVAPVAEAAPALHSTASSGACT